MDQESLRLLLAQGMSVERIAQRFGRHPSTVSYWMNKHGLEAPNREKHAVRGGIDREELERYVEAGMTIAEIGEAVGLSKSAVRHWLARYQLRTQNKVGPRLGKHAVAGKEARKLEIVFDCIHHGPTAYVLEGRGYYRCKRCRSEGISRHRRRLKETLVAEAGGRCVICGYDRSLAALEFHHLDPSRSASVSVRMGSLCRSMQFAPKRPSACSSAPIVTPRWRTASRRFPYSLRTLARHRE